MMIKRTVVYTTPNNYSERVNYRAFQFSRTTTTTRERMTVNLPTIQRLYRFRLPEDRLEYHVSAVTPDRVNFIIFDVALQFPQYTVVVYVQMCHYAAVRAPFYL